MTQTPDRLNRLIAGLVFLASLSLYWSTVAPTFSFWDCGEFVASSAILGILQDDFTIAKKSEEIGRRLRFLHIVSL